MWPLNPQNCIKQLKTFNPSMETDTYVDEPALPIMPWIQPTTLSEMGEGLGVWNKKFKKGQKRLKRGEGLWSDPARPENLDSFIDTSKNLCAEGELKGMELAIFRQRKLDELKQKSTSRKRLRPASSGLGLTKEGALEQIAIKEKEAEVVEKGKERRNFKKIWSIEKNAKHVEGVAARKAEKARVRTLKELSKQGLTVLPDSELLILICDPEAE